MLKLRDELKFEKKKKKQNYFLVPYPYCGGILPE